MSTDDSNKNKPDDHKAPGESTTSSMLKSSVRTAVRATNNFLASLQHTTESVSEPVLKGIHAAQDETASLAGRALHAYQTYRHEYGPHAVVGSGVAAGGLYALRRGKIPGIVAGTLVGGLSYLAIYESSSLPSVEQLPDYVFGNNNNNDNNNNSVKDKK